MRSSAALRQHDDADAAAAAGNELRSLVQQLADADAALQAYGGGGIDSVVSPDGQMLLLRQAQEALRRSEEAFRGIVEASIDCVVTTDASGVIIEFNPAAERTFGYARHEILGRSLTDTIIPVRYRAAHAQAWSHYLRSGERRILGRRIEIEACRADGSELPIELTVTRLGTDDPPVFSAFIRDLTERRLLEEQQRASEQRFRALVENSFDAISLADATGKILYCSPAVERMLGYRDDEIIGRVWLDFVHPTDRGAMQAQLVDILERPNTAVQSTRRVRHKDGSWRIIEGVLTNLLAEPAVSAVVNNFRDVTERKRAAEDLERIFDLSPDMICTAGFDGYFKKLNPAFERTLGYTNEELRAAPFLSFVHAADQTKTIATAVALAQGGEVTSFENRYRHKDGSYRWFQWSSRPDLDQQVIYAVCRDVTEAKEAETQLAKLRREQDLILTSIADGVHVLDRDGRVIFENPAAARMLGYAPQEMVGKLSHATIHYSHPDGAHYPREHCPFYRTMQDAISRSGTEVLWRKDGTPLPIEYNSTPLRDADSTVLGAVVSFRDITEKKKAAEELRRSEMLFQELADAMPQMVWAGGADGLLDYFNKRTVEYTGCSTQELVGSGWLAVLHPDDTAECVARWTHSVQTGESYDIEFRLRRASDGLFRWHLGRALPVRDEKGGIIRWFGTCTDIHDHKVALETLRRSEENLALAQRVSHTGSWEAVIKGNAVGGDQPLRYSDETFRIFGLEPRSTDITQAEFFKYVHPADHAGLMRAVEEMVNSSGSLSFDHRIVLADGTERLVHEEATLIRLPDGETSRIIGTMQDITERRRAEDLLRQQAEILNLAHDAIIVRGYEDEQIIFWNKGAERLYGWSAKEAIGSSVRELIYSGPEQLEPVIDALTSTGEFSGELRHVTKSGSEVEVRVSSTLVRDRDGQPRSVLSINTDITDQKKLEQQLLRGQRLESIGTLASGVAHDLNNILSPILMAAPLLRDEMSAANRDKLVGLVEQSAERGAAIVKQVLTFARGADGEHVLIQPAYLLKEMTKIVEETFPRSIAVRASYPDDLWLITGDATQLHQVLLNLCVNARDAMPEGGSLALGAENFEVDSHFASMTTGVQPGPHVLISVTDSGSGIPPHVMDKIFDPFFTTKEIGKGTGLGLSTVLGIVKSHHGGVNVYSTPSGTTFRILLPAAPNTRAAEPTESSVEAAGGRGEIILVVDDEPAIREAAERLLSSSGYKVLLADDGPSALAIYAQRSRDIALVLTDFMMPVMNGLTLARAIRRISPAARIVMSTGREDDCSESELRTVGVEVALTKPYTQKALLRALDRVLRSEVSPA